MQYIIINIQISKFDKCQKAFQRFFSSLSNSTVEMVYKTFNLHMLRHTVKDITT